MKYYQKLTMQYDELAIKEMKAIVKHLKNILPYQKLRKKSQREKKTMTIQKIFKKIFIILKLWLATREKQKDRKRK